MGIPQPKVSGMMHGDFTHLSERKLMDCLNRLGYDIEIKNLSVNSYTIVPSRTERGVGANLGQASRFVGCDR
jgi:hypothetical protein